MFWPTQSRILYRSGPICNTIDVKVVAATEDPLNSSVTLTGDLNLPRIGNSSIPLAAPNRTRARNIGSAAEGVPMSLAHSRIFTNLFDKMHEIPVGQPTHVNFSNLTENEIDRVLTSIPPSGLINLTNSAGVVATPMDLFAQGISDHAGIYWCCKIRTKKPNIAPRINPEWCRKPEFGKICRDILEKTDFSETPVNEKIRVCKEVFRYTANKVRDHYVVHEPLSKASSLCTLSSIARAAWTGNTQLASRLIATTLQGPVHLSLVGSHPKLVNPRAFEAELRLAKAAHLNQQKTYYKNRGQTPPPYPAHFRENGAGSLGSLVLISLRTKYMY